MTLLKLSSSFFTRFFARFLLLSLPLLPLPQKSLSETGSYYVVQSRIELVILLPRLQHTEAPYIFICSLREQLLYSTFEMNTFYFRWVSGG